MLHLEIRSELTKTKEGRRLIEFIKAKYKECFYIAKNDENEKKRLKALEMMAFLDIIISKIQEDENGK